MTTFRSLVSEYSNCLANRVILTARYAGEVGEENFDQIVLLHKLDKHFENNNARSCASYLQMWISEEFGKLPVRAIEIALRLKLKTDGKSVGYLHADGTYHWFCD
jgi:hypothetical protein